MPCSALGVLEAVLHGSAPLFGLDAEHVNNPNGMGNAPGGGGGAARAEGRHSPIRARYIHVIPWEMGTVVAMPADG
eukprot:SAG31_NODE_1456_length_8264_cov_4.918570_3_plen_76_part_00